MNIIAFGVNHKTAPIDVREQFYLNSTQQDLLLSELRLNPAVVEAFVLSTCNRTEIYAHVLRDDNFFAYFIKLLAKARKLSFDKSLSGHFYVYYDQEAVFHLLKVITGLDSLVLGEKQILGQVKNAMKRAQDEKMFSGTFNLLSNIAIRAGKKAQAETHISYGGSSVSWAAVTMAEQALNSLDRKSVLIIGAGKMGEIALNQLRAKNVGKIYLMNRTQSIAEELAGKYGGIAAGFCDIKEILTEVDVCFCSAGAPHYVVEKEMVEKVMTARESRPLTLIDISMPRNIDPRTAGIKNVALSDLDDLDKTVGENMQRRRQAVSSVEKIIAVKLSEFYRKLAKQQSFADSAV